MKNTGQIIKSKLTERFVTLPNDLARAESLTMEEKGLMLYIMSLPSDWVIFKQNLYVSMPADQKGSIDRVFKSLQKKGYIQSVKVTNKKGQFIGWNHVVFDYPLGPDGNPTSTNAELGVTPLDPTSTNAELGHGSPILNTEDNTKKEEIEQISVPSEPVADSLHIKIKKEFMAFYEKHKGTTYYWKPIDGKKTNSVINQISFKIKEKLAGKGNVVVTDDSVMRGFVRLLDLMKNDTSPWYMLHLSMSNIDSKFNEIVALSTAPVKPKVKDEPKFVGPVPQNV